MKYLHIITLDKFTKWFVELIYNNFNPDEHVFIVYGKNREFRFQCDQDKVRYLEAHHHIKKDKIISAWIKDSKLIIVNGLFGAERCLLHFSPAILRKTYLMFWGGDFYQFTPKIPITKIKAYLQKKIRKYLIRYTAGVINLIDGDYDELCKIITPKGKHFIAPMVGNGEVRRLVERLYSSEKNDVKTIEKNDVITIVVGNSATKTNQHLQVFQLLEKYKEQNIRIICPLSYGNEMYREKVIQYGTDIFKSKFVPLIEYMDREAYFKILSSANVAIFNNNRQQAMGNIHACLGLGIKVFIRNDTSMWEHYDKKLGYAIFDLETIADLEFHSFVWFEADNAARNHDIYLKNTELKKRIEAWQAVFDSVEEAANE